MSEYCAYSKEGEYTIVYDLDKCLKAIHVGNEDNEERIKRLLEENEKLKTEAYKDNELKQMKKLFEKMKSNYYRGFPITEKEAEAISKWKKKHEVEVHGLTTDAQRLKVTGSIGEKWIWCNWNENQRGYRFYKVAIDRYTRSELFEFIVGHTCAMYCCSMEII